MKSSLCAGLEVLLLRLRGRSSTRGSLAKDIFSPSNGLVVDSFRIRTRNAVQKQSCVILCPYVVRKCMEYNGLIHQEIEPLRLLQPVSRSKKALLLNWNLTVPWSMPNLRSQSLAQNASSAVDSIGDLQVLCEGQVKGCFVDGQVIWTIGW